MNNYRYRVVEVAAFNLRKLDSDKTQSIPTWLIPAIATMKEVDGTADWVVKKPDGSFGYYRDEDFYREFEEVQA